MCPYRVRTAAVATPATNQMSAVATPATSQMHLSTTIDLINREFPAAASRLVWRIVRASNIDLPSCECAGPETVSELRRADDASFERLGSYTVSYTHLTLPTILLV